MYSHYTDFLANKSEKKKFTLIIKKKKLGVTWSVQRKIKAKSSERIEENVYKEGRRRERGEGKRREKEGSKKGRKRFCYAGFETWRGCFLFLFWLCNGKCIKSIILLLLFFFSFFSTSNNELELMFSNRQLKLKNNIINACSYPFKKISSLKSPAYIVHQHRTHSSNVGEADQLNHPRGTSPWEKDSFLTRPLSNSF